MSGPLHVLVVDDDYRVADLHAQFTRSIPGFDVVGVAHTAATAVDQAQALRPDLVLLDQYLPDGRGTDIVGRLGCDVIMLTAASEASAVRAALGHGVVNYLVKPFSPDELGQRLRAYGRYREHLRANKPLSQTDIDRAITLLRAGDTMQTTARKGRSPHTAKLVIDLLREHPRRAHRQRRRQPARTLTADRAAIPRRPRRGWPRRRHHALRDRRPPRTPLPLAHDLIRSRRDPGSTPR